MAYSEEIKAAAREYYVRDNLPLEQIATRLRVAFTTVKRWKKDVEGTGNDWDRLRAATTLTGDGANQQAHVVLSRMMEQFNRVLESLEGDPKISPMDQVKAMASLSDAMAKAMSLMGRVLPEESRLAAGMLTLSKLSTFIREKYPQYLPIFAEIVEPFGGTLPDIFKNEL